jgi:hypothetical protein
VAELQVPQLVESPFRQHYRELILGSIARAAEAEMQQHRLRGGGWFGPGLRSSARMVWAATFVVLVCDLAGFGLDSWTTTVADLGLIILTFVWFGVCVEDLLPEQEAPSAQLGLFE